MGQDLADRGHEVAHVTYSRRAARMLEERGFTAWCLPDEMERLLAAEAVGGIDIVEGLGKQVGGHGANKGQPA